MALQGPLGWHSGVAVLGDRPSVLPGGLSFLGVDFPYLQPRRQAYHGESIASRVGLPGRHSSPDHAPSDGFDLAFARRHTGRKAKGRSQVTDPSKNSMGAPGLAFETWDPCNRSQLGNPSVPLSSRAQAEGSAVRPHIST